MLSIQLVLLLINYNQSRTVISKEHVVWIKIIPRCFSLRRHVVYSLVPKSLRSLYLLDSWLRESVFINLLDTVRYKEGNIPINYRWLELKRYVHASICCLFLIFKYMAWTLSLHSYPWNGTLSDPTSSQGYTSLLYTYIQLAKGGNHCAEFVSDQPRYPGYS